MNRSIGAVSTVTLITALACASAPGTRPRDMSAVEHGQAATEHDKAGAEHAAQFRPASRDAAAESDCTQYLRSCWTSNPTEGHAEEARKHRALAAKHRAAFETLRQTEERACAGLSEEDRDVSPFVHREAIVRVAPLVVSTTTGLGSTDASTEQVGATIVMQPAVGLTAERLQRAVTCHVARSASLGHAASDLSFCPLAVKGAKANVSSTGDAFAINVSADSREGAQEVLARAQRLIAR